MPDIPDCLQMIKEAEITGDIIRLCKELHLFQISKALLAPEPKKNQQK